MFTPAGRIPRTGSTRSHRRTVRGLVALAVAGSAVLMSGGTASAASGFDMYDVDGNGVIDPYAIDASGDGRLDMNLIDYTGDGRADAWLVDSNEDGVLDQVWADTNGDGHVDTWVYDDNEDGVTDLKLLDWTGDGVADGQPGVGGNPTLPRLNFATLCTPTDGFWCGRFTAVTGPGTYAVSPALGGPSLAGAENGLPPGVTGR